MAQIENLEKVVASLRNKAARVADGPQVSGVVGYTAEYAIFVHERLDLHHEPPTQAKFLEQPLREHANEFAAGIRADLRAGRTLGQAILRQCLLLQRYSQQIAPVDTGNLKGSAFTRLDIGK